MSRVVSRTCTEVPDNERDREPSSRPLDAYRAAPAYVLLGDPGSGKSTAFERECEACGVDGVLVSARDFLTFEPSSHPEWHGKTLFLDGLDEVRAGQPDARVPLDSIRRNLDGLGKPRFRLSCRAADWLGTNDSSNMAAVAPDRSLTVLRLDPLTDLDIEEIVESDPRISDSRAFIREARDRAVDGFLANPQTLDMLADVVGGGNWPASRLELFEQACQRMAREHNKEHIAAARSPVLAGRSSLEDVLGAAGRLCAIQLIAGVAGYAVTPNQENDDFRALDRCEGKWAPVRASHRDGASPSDLLDAARATKLFRAAADGRFTSVHRHVGEFLGARYLARLIAGRKPGQGLPTRRVLALISGGDGIVVSQLRGLSAWIAAQCREARPDLVERDPIGVGLYGDVGKFSTDEKCALLESLEAQTSRLFSTTGAATAFAPLVVPAMEPVFRKILTAEKLKEQQSFARFALHILAHGSRLPNLASDLLTIVRGDGWSRDVRVAALDAFLHNRPKGRKKANELKKLLADIRAGRLPDPDDELLGTLLADLYPDELSPSDVWEHLSVRPGQTGFRYYHFWWRILVEPRAHVAAHLDALAARLLVAVPAAQSLVKRNAPVNLLAQGLETHGDEIETKRLYDWLGVGLAPRTAPDSDALRRTRCWLEQRPEIQKSIFAEGLRRAKCGSGETDRILRNDVWPRLHGSNPPDDFGFWCLQRAKAETDRACVAFLVERACRAVIERRGDEGLSVDVLIEHTHSHPVLADAFAPWRKCPIDDGHQKHTRQMRERSEEKRRRRGQWIAHVRSQEDALRANRGSPDLLHQIAAGYFGFLPESEGNGPLDRLRNLFFRDGGLMETARVALRDAIRRDDLPDIDGIISRREKNREHYLSLPVKAGLAEIDRGRQDVSRHLDDWQMRIALGFHYCDGAHYGPAWYQRLLVSNPELVADVLVRCASSALRAGRTCVSGLAELAHDEDHAKVARMASLRILRSFPVRCAASQLVDLNYLLWSALRHADRASLTKLIERKLSRTSMNVGQRARWLAAAFMLSPKAHSQRVMAFADKNERRIRHLAAFLGNPDGPRIWHDGLGTTGLQALVRLIGVSFGPHISPSGEATMATPTMGASGHVQRMIQRLAESPSDEAGVALQALASDESLIQWRDELVHARDQQRVIRRDAAYRPPKVEQVCRTLNDGPPANVGDLTALITDRLREIGVHIQRGNNNGWRPYWSEGKHRQPLEPKYEDSCRDALLGDLRSRLPQELVAEAEARYANDTRADIRVACDDFHVPVEIKRHYHPRLWSAIRNQLIERYTRDPSTGGHGIYLVLWFGETPERRVPPPPSGLRPNGPKALQARLQQLLTPEERRRVFVCVLDVSP